MLSFTHGKIDPDTNRTYLGDIVISYDQAKKQSTQKSISIEEEIFYLSIHGILHLLGYDHADADEEKVMFKLQEKLFRDEIIDE